MRHLLTALVLSGVLGSAAWADDFHFGEQNGASLGAKIENGRLIYALQNSTKRPWKYMVHMAAQFTMYDNLDLVVIDPNRIVHHFGFVDGRDGSGPVYKTLAPGDLYQESIDLLLWNRINARNRVFCFKLNEVYQVYLHYFWSERIDTAEIYYGPIDSRMFEIVLKDGSFSEVKE